MAESSLPRTPGSRRATAIQHQSGAKLAAAEDEIADGKLLVGQVLGHAFVHAFVAAADEQQLIILGEAAGGFLGETLALRREQEDALSGLALGPDAFHGVEDGRGLEQHAFAAAERAIVDGAMAVVRPVAKVVDVDLDQAGFGGFGDDRRIGGGPGRSRGRW